MRRGTITAALYLVVVFLSGILLGGFGMSLYNSRSSNYGRNNGRQDEPRRRWERDLRDRLKLSDQQAAQLATILKDTRERYRELSSKWEPEARAIMDRQHDAIRAILTDEQRAEYEKMRQERDQRRRQGQKKGPPPPRPPHP